MAWNHNYLQFLNIFFMILQRFPKIYRASSPYNVNILNVAHVYSQGQEDLLAERLIKCRQNR